MSLENEPVNLNELRMNFRPLIQRVYQHFLTKIARAWRSLIGENYLGCRLI